MVQRAPPTILGLQLPVPYGFFLPFPVGVPRLELGTSALSGLRSNQLSYTPNLLFVHKLSGFCRVCATTATTKCLRIGLRLPTNYLSTIPYHGSMGRGPFWLGIVTSGPVSTIVEYARGKFES